MILKNSKCSNKTRAGTLAYYVLGREYLRAINESRYNEGDDLALQDKLNTQEFKDLKESYPQPVRWGMDLFFQTIPDSDIENFWSESTCQMDWPGLACMAFTKYRIGECPSEVRNDPFYAKLPHGFAPEDYDLESDPPPPQPKPKDEDITPVTHEETVKDGTNWWVVGGAVAIGGLLIWGVTRK
jgi:hypothetical protein